MKSMLVMVVVCFVVGAMAEVEHGSLFQTGQKKSYESGDDGDHQAGIPHPKKRFIHNNDGTITDKMTGLIWLKNANAFGTLPWESALDTCNVLKDGEQGLKDGSKAGEWRLPNRLELESLIDFSKYGPPGDPFTDTQDSHAYWSSTTGASNPERAWRVDMTGGNIGGGYISEAKKVDAFCVWPVRGGVKSGKFMGMSKQSTARYKPYENEFSSLPEELIAAREKYEQKVTETMEEFRPAYIAHLNDLKIQLVKNDDLEGALAVKDEIERVSKSEPNF